VSTVVMLVFVPTLMSPVGGWERSAL